MSIMSVLSEIHIFHVVIQSVLFLFSVAFVGVCTIMQFWCSACVFCCVFVSECVCVLESRTDCYCVTVVVLCVSVCLYKLQCVNTVCEEVWFEFYRIYCRSELQNCDKVIEINL